MGLRVQWRGKVGALGMQRQLHTRRFISYCRLAKSKTIRSATRVGATTSTDGRYVFIDHNTSTMRYEPLWGLNRPLYAHYSTKRTAKKRARQKRGTSSSDSSLKSLFGPDYGWSIWLWLHEPPILSGDVLLSPKPQFVEVPGP